MTDGAARARVLYTGTVQGVGFRWRAHRCSAGLGLTGFVRNLDDGRVELVAEGPRPRVARLLAAISGEMGALIEDEEVVWSSAAGDLGPFAITR